MIDELVGVGVTEGHESVLPASLYVGGGGSEEVMEAL